MREHRAHVALTIFATAVVAWGVSSPVGAQTASAYIEPNPNVTVDLSVLDGFGGAPNVADMLRPGYVQQGYGQPVYGVPGMAPSAAPAGTAPAIPSFLVRPDAPRYAAPPPEVMALIQGRSGNVRAPLPAATAPVLRQPSAPRPAPAVPPASASAAPANTAPPRTAPTQTAAAAPPPAPPASSLPKKVTAPAPPPPPPSLPAATNTVPAPPPPEPKVAAVNAAPASPPAAPAPSSQGTVGDTVRIAFAAGQSQLPADATAKLDAVIGRLQKDDALRIQLMAFADGDTEGANKARRLSLSRALAVRAYLIDHEVASTRMDVRALGNRSDDGPADRVDVVVVNR